VQKVEAKDKDFDKFCKELEKRGRFTLVQDRSSADVLISLDAKKVGGQDRLFSNRIPTNVPTSVEVGKRNMHLLTIPATGLDQVYVKTYIAY
jgi:hypothetical protein